MLELIPTWTVEFNVPGRVRGSARASGWLHASADDVDAVVRALRFSGADDIRLRLGAGRS